MTSTRRWERAAALPVPIDGRPRAQVVSLAPELPTLDELFTFMRDAELRFETLRMRIEERVFATRGEQLVVTDVVLAHPGRARVTTTEPGHGTAGNYDVWISDGEVVRTYSGRHRLGTQRPVRPSIRGLDGSGIPGSSRVYRPLTALPMETLPETFIHPAGYCQNVLATGRCWISGTDVVAGREAIVVECEHPRTIEQVADRPDFRIRIAVDRLDGVITRLVETIAGEITRHAEVVVFEPDAALPPAAFEFTFPTGTSRIY